MDNIKIGQEIKISEDFNVLNSKYELNQIFSDYGIRTDDFMYTLYDALGNILIKQISILQAAKLAVNVVIKMLKRKIYL